MKPRATQAALKRLDALEQMGRGRRTVFAWPRLMGVDEWSALALPMQAKLVAEARDDQNVSVVIESSQPDPMDATHRYKPDRARPG